MSHYRAVEEKMFHYDEEKEDHCRGVGKGTFQLREVRDKCEGGNQGYSVNACSGQSELDRHLVTST